VTFFDAETAYPPANVKTSNSAPTTTRNIGDGFW
jgi:hypothetical protein